LKGDSSISDLDILVDSRGVLLLFPFETSITMRLASELLVSVVSHGDISRLVDDHCRSGQHTGLLHHMFLMSNIVDKLASGQVLIGQSI
jgi:hypothetical protein